MKLGPRVMACALALMVCGASCGPSSSDREPDGAAAAADASAQDRTLDVDARFVDAAVRCNGNPTLADPPTCASLGVTIDPFYADKYSCFDLGAVPGVPAQKYGGVTLLPGSCSSTFIMGGEANAATGKLYAIQVARNGRGQIGGFTGSATVYAEAAFNDGGVEFGPGGVLFLARYPSNELGQIKPGSTMTDRIIDLSALSVTASPGGLGFVPTGFAGAGTLKLVSWPGGQWYTLAFSAAANGTYDITTATAGPTLTGGPEGFTYVKSGNPDFAADSMLVSEWSGNSIATYEIDAQGDPIIATRRLFLSGLTGAEGAYRDPDTGDFFFSTWSSGVDRVIVIRGFLPIIQ